MNEETVKTDDKHEARNPYFDSEEWLKKREQWPDWFAKLYEEAVSQKQDGKIYDTRAALHSANAQLVSDKIK